MGKTSAERQEAFRKRHREAGGGVLAVQLNAAAKGALARLAVFHGQTQREYLEMLLEIGESSLLAALNEGEKEAYIEGRLRFDDVADKGV